MFHLRCFIFDDSRFPVERERKPQFAVRIQRSAEISPGQINKRSSQVDCEGKMLYTEAVLRLMWSILTLPFNRPTPYLPWIQKYLSDFPLGNQASL